MGGDGKNLSVTVNNFENGKIVSTSAMEILDSRGNPTIRVFVKLDDGTIKRAYFAKIIQGERTLWYTDEEFEAKKQKLDSEKAKIKLVDKQGKKLGN